MIGGAASGENGERAARVVLVDDHGLFRVGLRALLSDHGFRVIAEAADGEAGIKIVERTRPDVVVMDLSMPRMSGIEAIARLAASSPEVRVLVVTVSASGDDVVEAILAGACGYVLKDAPVATIVEAVRAAAAGESLISPRMNARLLERLRRDARRSGVAASALTPRELEVLRLITKGMDNVEIAAALHISPHTVRNHVSSILEKMDVENRIQAAVRAVQSGLA